ncbi:MAG: hypothetical protein WDN04_28185 [Rhodospirillales bacterium]
MFVSSSRQAFPTNIITPNKTLATVLAAQGIVPGINTQRSATTSAATPMTTMAVSASP